MVLKAGILKIIYCRKYNIGLKFLQKEEEGFDHQEAKMPSVPAPEMVTNVLFPLLIKLFSCLLLL